jgi:hypothetical protein
MGVFIQDLGREDHKLMCNWWNWRPTLELIATHVEGLEPEQIERMGLTGGSGRLTKAQAQAFARALRTKVLPAIPAGGRMLYNGTITAEPDNGTFYREELEKNYTATKIWLENFCSFLERCDGFEVV